MIFAICHAISVTLLPQSAVMCCRRDSWWQQ